MGNRGPVRYRKYTEEFKVEAVRLAEAVEMPKTFARTVQFELSDFGI